MRISDWSSDVCSSDLKPLDPLRPDQVGPSGYSGTIGVMPTLQAKPMTSRDIDDVIDAFAKGAKTAYDLGFDGVAVHGRSEERRVGKECVSPCRSRWSP